MQLHTERLSSCRFSIHFYTQTFGFTIDIRVFLALLRVCQFIAKFFYHFFIAPIVFYIGFLLAIIRCCFLHSSIIPIPIMSRIHCFIEDKIVSAGDCCELYVMNSLASPRASRKYRAPEDEAIRIAAPYIYLIFSLQKRAF